jgi:4-amino-4-deoxy-L-arabinose transferase-like glycosyltransferase
MIAENFYRHGFNILYPQINWAGPAPGYVGTEFPLVPLLASVCYLLFGVQDWNGRAISVAFFAASVPFFYLLVKQISTAQSGLLAAGVYTLTPLSVFTNRSFMPDMASLSCSLAALYLFAAWLTRPPHPLLFLATTLATSLAILVKVPAVILGLPLFYLAWQAYGAQLFR